MKKLSPLAFALLITSAAIGQPNQKNSDSLVARSIHKRINTIDAHIDLRPDFNARGNSAAKETVDQFDLQIGRAHV